jgi:hypothetical protein
MFLTSSCSTQMEELTIGTQSSVQGAAICIFKELNLDMLILARCAPGHSWRNPAERIMSLLNIGLQNCALERERSTELTEKVWQHG